MTREEEEERRRWRSLVIGAAAATEMRRLMKMARDKKRGEKTRDAERQYARPKLTYMPEVSRSDRAVPTEARCPRPN